MDFGQAISTCFKKYIDFNGRAQRAEFWWFALFVFIVNIVARATVGDAGAIGGLIILGMFIPFVAVAARRYHDVGRSGWWALTFLLPLVGVILALIWLTKRGTIGPNQYGDDPLGGYPGEETHYREYDARNDGEMFRGNTQREPRDRDKYRSEPRAEYRDTSREEKAPQDKAPQDNAPEGPWADRKPKDDPEPPKQIKEEKKRKIEPPRFGRDARKKGD